MSACSTIQGRDLDQTKSDNSNVTETKVDLQQQKEYDQCMDDCVGEFDRCPDMNSNSTLSLEDKKRYCSVSFYCEEFRAKLENKQDTEEKGLIREELVLVGPCVDQGE